MCGLLIFVVPQSLQSEIGVFYQICLAVVFFLSSMWLRRNARLHKYFQVFFAFFVASFTLFLQYIVEVLGWSSSTIDGIVFSKLLSTLLVIIPILLLTKISGNDMVSIYVKKGKLRVGLIVGLVAFLLFLVTSVQGATMIFAGQNITFERVIHWLARALSTLKSAIHEKLVAKGYRTPF